MTHQQQTAQAVMQELSDSLNVRALTANPEHAPSSTCDYYMFADTFTYQKVYCRVAVTVYLSGEIDVALSAKSQCNSRPEYFRWGISSATVAEAVAEFPAVIYQAKHVTMDNELRSWMDSPIEQDYIPKHQPPAPKVADFTATDYATLNARMEALVMDTFVGDDAADKTLQDNLINLFAKLD